jgi:hypothetical protein
MAEGDITLYRSFLNGLGAGLFDLSSSDNHTVTVTLHVAYSPDVDAHTQWSDVSATEYGSSDGYTAGGQVLQTTTWVSDSDTGVTTFDAADVTWSSLGPLDTATPSHAILWDNTATSDDLIGYMELGTTATNGGDYTITWSSDGVFYSS